MADLIDDDIPEEEGESFADLLNAYSPDNKDNPGVGDKIKGKIISIGKENVFVDTGSKIDGAVELKELLDENGAMPFAVGDTLDLYVTKVEESEITLSRAISGAGGANMLKDAYRSAIPVEGKVTGPCKGGFNVEILKRRAFCPISQMDVKFIENQDLYVGQTHQFLITQFEDNGKNIVVSRRRLLEIELEKQRAEFMKDLVPGSILDGTITKIMPYGVFVELSPGVEGMAHISELSWSRIQKPEEVFSQGEKVKAVVLDIKAPEKDRKAPKIALSLKQLSSDPWDTVQDRYQAGQKITGTVTRCMAFGAFVELEPGIEGLVHISEMSHTRRVLKTEDVMPPGAAVTVLIKEIDSKNRRISLSLKEMEGDPWESVPAQFQVGKTVTGQMEQKADFGWFIQLTPGVIGLMPKSNAAKAADPRTMDKLKPGDAIPVLIDAIDTAGRKITLSPADGGGEAQWQEYKKEPEQSQGFGSLAEKLQSALNRKKDK